MKTNAKHFKIFKAECEKWINIAGLVNWCVRYYHQDDGDDGTLAWTSFQYGARSVNIYLNRTWNKSIEISEYELKQSAFHEVCEVLLYPLRYLSEARFLAHGDIDTEIHNVIRVLENVLWEKK